MNMMNIEKLAGLYISVKIIRVAITVLLAVLWIFLLGWAKGSFSRKRKDGKRMEINGTSDISRGQKGEKLDR